MEGTNTRQSQFKELTFANEKEFNEWLEKNQSIVIDLEGRQDMSRIHVHAYGEILHTDFHSKLYAGRFIGIDNLAKGNYMRITDEHGEMQIMQGLCIHSVRKMVEGKLMQVC